MRCSVRCILCQCQVAIMHLLPHSTLSRMSPIGIVQPTEAMCGRVIRLRAGREVDVLDEAHLFSRLVIQISNAHLVNLLFSAWPKSSLHSHP